MGISAITDDRSNITQQPMLLIDIIRRQLRLPVEHNRRFCNIQHNLRYCNRCAIKCELFAIKI